MTTLRLVLGVVLGVRHGRDCSLSMEPMRASWTLSNGKTQDSELARTNQGGAHAADPSCGSTSARRADEEASSRPAGPTDSQHFPGTS
jgi:hypothetical protein